MGTAELLDREILLRSHLITYGQAATPELTQQMREEIETLWNEPAAQIAIFKQPRRVVFRITGECIPDLTDITVYQNTDPHINYFRIEAFAKGNISFVDGIGCNSGYFKLENLYAGSTTAAHEYGHTLGLQHPTDLDLRGKVVPGIMYPRGTLVDPEFQYDPARPAGTTGGTLHPMYRKVLTADIQQLKLHQLFHDSRLAIVGAFTNVWHPDHARMDPDLFFSGQ